MADETKTTNEVATTSDNTAPAVDPLSLLMGWRMGNMVRNMRLGVLAN